MQLKGALSWQLGLTRRKRALAFRVHDNCLPFLVALERGRRCRAQYQITPHGLISLGSRLDELDATAELLILQECFLLRLRYPLR